MHLPPGSMLRLKLGDDTGDRSSDVCLAKHAVDSTIAANAFFASDAEGAKWLVRVSRAYCS